MYSVLRSWAVRTTTSFAALLSSASVRDAPHSGLSEGGGLIYRLKTWPDLPPGLQQARVYRVLSVMSQRPVNRRWMLAHCGLREEQLDGLIDLLLQADAVEVIDSSQFG
jgi:hypothetical protein